MKVKMPFAERREQHRIMAEIRLQADAAAEFLLDRDPASASLFNAGPVPGEQISPEVYSRAVGSLAMQSIATEMNPTVAYDHEASLQATDTMRAVRSEGQLPPSLDPVIVVFRLLGH